jgi:pectate lyase
MAFAILLLGGVAFARDGVRQSLKNSSEWFAGDDARLAAARILSYQSESGGWPKNIDTTAATFSGNRRELRPTFDNGATTDELRFLARIYGATKDERYAASFAKGLDYILQAQYPNGGWPQSFPLPEGYGRYITFNDDAMVRLLRFLREVDSDEAYAFITAGRRAAARHAFARGIECILMCQIKVEGQLTAWCAQHDPQDYSPRPARTFELASLSGSESAEIVRLLMSLESPGAEVVRSVEAAVAWFERVQLRGIRQVDQPDAKSPRGTNKVIINDESAGPLWARFYEIGTNRPIFVDRDGVVRYHLAEIGYERRNGYGWYVSAPQSLLERDYPAWKSRLSGRSTP